MRLHPYICKEGGLTLYLRHINFIIVELDTEYMYNIEWRIFFLVFFLVNQVPFDVPLVVAVFDAEDSSVADAVVTFEEPFNVFITTG